MYAKCYLDFTYYMTRAIFKLSINDNNYYYQNIF